MAFTLPGIGKAEEKGTVQSRLGAGRCSIPADGYSSPSCYIPSLLPLADHVSIPQAFVLPFMPTNFKAGVLRSAGLHGYIPDQRDLNTNTFFEK